MPIIKSAKKRVRVARRATLRNFRTKRTMKSALKSYHANISAKKDVADAHAKAQSAIDTAVKKGIIHKNKAARLKKQLAAKAQSHGVKLAGAAKKAAKPAAKKTSAKKPVAKKSPAKKPTTKK